MKVAKGFGLIGLIITLALVVAIIVGLYETQKGESDDQSSQNPLGAIEEAERVAESLGKGQQRITDEILNTD